MKTKRFLSCLSLILALLFIALQMGMLSSCRKGPDGDDTTSSSDPADDTSAEETTAPIGGSIGEADVPEGIKYVDTKGKTVVNANYCKDLAKRTVPAYYHLTPNTDTAPKSSVGFLWNAETAVVIVTFDSADKVTVDINGHKVEASSLSGKTSTEFEISFADTGILPQDLGQLVPAVVTVEKGSEKSSFDGYFQLTDYKVCFSTDGNTLDDFTTVSATQAGSNTQLDAAVAGVKAENGFIRMYDLYARGKGKAHTQVKLSATGLSAMSTTKNYTFETDITVASMPVTSPSFVGSKSAYGLAFNLTPEAGAGAPFVVLINTVDGLAMVTFGDSEESFMVTYLSKELGDTFHLSFAWTTMGKIIIAVDGYALKTVSDSTAVRGFTSKSINIVWQRENKAPASDKDSFDVSFDSITVSFDQSKSLTDNITIQELFGDLDVVKLDGDEIYLAPEKLIIEPQVSSKKYGLDATAYWYSSNILVIGNDGVLTPPSRSGELVKVTLMLISGDTIVTEKEFNFFAKGENPDTTVNSIKGDSDPVHGKGEPADTIFSLDKNLNSVVYDMGEVTKINRVTVNSTESIGLVDRSYISLFYSNDNETYTYLEDYSMFQDDRSVYFYNIDIEARYIKVHSTLNGAYLQAGRMINSLQKLVKAEYTDLPLLSSDNFAKETTMTVTNAKDETVYDKVVSFTLEEMGISASDMKEDMSDIRFIAEGVYLPHYYYNGVFYVRVLEIAANSSVKVKILYSNKDAKSVSDGNEVFEIVYGTKNAWRYTTKGWQHDAIVAPNGDILKFVSFGGDKLQYYRSTNGGMTFSDYVEIPEAEGEVNSAGGAIVDYDTGTIFYFAYWYRHSNPSAGYNPDGSLKEDWVCTYKIFTSTDNGYTWSKPVIPSNHPEYALSYSDGIKLSTADGDGPEVDYVFTTGQMRDLKTAAFCTTAIYSKDGGKTWTFSNSKINFTGGSSSFFEGGMSEEAVFEQKDGTIVFYARCQQDDILHFAISRSYDKGITWSDITLNDFSNIYTLNTQPIIERLDGELVLMHGGNNSMGGRTYLRYPLSFATTDDDGNTFKDLIDASFGTPIATFVRDEGQMLHTNPDLAFYEYGGTDLCYFVSTRHEMYIYNVDDFLYKTKGGFDSFEDGITPDGWLTSKGGLSSSTIGVTDGEKSMKILSSTTAVRSLHYIEEGSITFDLYVNNIGETLTIELQSAFNDKTQVTAPIRIVADPDGNLFCYTQIKSSASRGLGLKLEKGQNTITFEFDGNAKTAKIIVNGKSADLVYIDGIANYISFATFFTTKNTDIYVDRFFAIRND